MAIKAFVLIEATIGKAKEVVSALQKIEGIISIDEVTGPYDIIAVIEQNDLNAIGKLLTTKIHPIAGVNRTISCLSIRIT